MIRVLLDTNIFIYSDAGDLEKSHEEAAIRIHRFSGKEVTLLLHAEGRRDIQSDKDETRRTHRLAMTEKYETLDFKLLPDEDFYRKLGTPPPKNPHDWIDDCLLYALYKNAVHYFVTNDVGVIKKAQRLDLQDRIFRPEDFYRYLVENFEKKHHMYPEVMEQPISEIDINDPIFDSLKADYSNYKPNFEEWYREKAREGRRAWVVRTEGKITGICIFDPKNKGYDGGLKLCTFKVDETIMGEKIGELLMKQVFSFCSKHGVEGVFVDFFESKADLQGFFEKYGFKFFKKKDGAGGEIVMKKDILSVKEGEVVSFQNLIETHFPIFYKPPLVDAFVVPIQGIYAERLFSDALPQPDLGFTPDPLCDRAIRKVYISNSGIKTLKPCDLLFFYLSRGDKSSSIIAYGVVEKTLRTNDYDQLVNFVGKSSVYTPEELGSLVSPEKQALAIKFWYLNPITSKDCTLERLKASKILKAQPQTIQKIDKKDYSEFTRLTHL